MNYTKLAEAYPIEEFAKYLEPLSIDSGLIPAQRKLDVSACAA